jgi:hypothetical protein
LRLHLPNPSAARLAPRAPAPDDNIEAEIRMIVSTMTPAEAQAFVAKFANGAAQADGSLDH